jgi:hypothetical protein
VAKIRRGAEDSNSSNGCEKPQKQAAAKNTENQKAAKNGYGDNMPAKVLRLGATGEEKS